MGTTRGRNAAFIWGILDLVLNLLAQQEGSPDQPGGQRHGDDQLDQDRKVNFGVRGWHFGNGLNPTILTIIQGVEPNGLNASARNKLS